MESTIILVVDSRDIGGIETHIFQLAQELYSRRQPVQVVFIKKYLHVHPQHALYEDLGIDVFYLSKPWDLFKIVKNHSPCILHSHGYKANIICRILQLLGYCAHISTYHAGEKLSWKLAIYNKMDNLLSYFGYKIAINKQLANKHRYNSFFIPNFIACPRHLTIAAPTKPITFAFIGRVSEEKGPDIFCEIAKQFQEHSLTFKLAGEGPLLMELKSRFAPYVDFVGKISTISEFLQNIHVLVITSRFEGMPLVVLEAMSHGVAVICYDVGNLAELIDHNTGILVTQHSVQAMVKAIHQYVEKSQTERDVLLKNAYKLTHEKYDASRVVDQIVAIYQKAQN